MPEPAPAKAGGVVVPDVAEKLPGRGMWVTASGAALKEAMAKKLFGRSAKQPVTIPADLLETTRTLLTQRALGLLGLARKAGDISVGTDAVLEGLRKKTLAAVITAADASAAGVSDMEQRTSTPVVRTALSATDLGAALGRDNAVYIGLPRGKQGSALLRDFLRLEGLTRND